MAFLVVGLGRSGTGLLTSLLNSHPNILCEWEIREETHHLLTVGCDNERCGRIIPIMEHSFTSEGNVKVNPLRDIIKNKDLKNVNVWGCNVKYGGYDYQVLSDVSLLKQFKIIHIIRLNVFEIV